MVTRGFEKRVSLFSVLIVTVFLLHPSDGSAQCVLNTAAKARGYKLTMTRAYRPCPSLSPFGNGTPNTETESNQPSCQPTFTYSGFSFDDGGKCSLKASQSVEAPCSLPGGSSACADLNLKARCGGIREPGFGGSPINGIGWMLGLQYRLTIDEAVAGPMTVIDFPLQIPFPAASSGRLSLSTSVNQACIALGACLPELPPCTSMQLQSATILDPNGDVFARPGSSTR